MNCEKCNAPLANGEQFCKKCGAAVTVVSASNPMGNPLNNTEMVTPNPTQTPENPGMFVNNSSMGVPTTNEIPANPTLANNQPVTNNAFVSQPVTNGSTASQAMNTQPKQTSNKSVLFIVIGIAVVLLLGCVYFATVYFKTKNQDPIPENPTEPIVEKNDYDITFGGFKAKVSSDLKFYIEDGYLYVYNNEETWVASFDIGEGEYSKYKTNVEEIKKIYEDEGCTVTNIGQKVVGGIEYTTLELSESGDNVIMAFAKANPTHTVLIFLYDIDNTFPYDLLEKTTPIINSFNYVGQSNSIIAEKKLDTSKIFDIVK